MRLRTAALQEFNVQIRLREFTVEDGVDRLVIIASFTLKAGGG